MIGIHLNHELDCSERRRLVFNGDLLLYSRNAATAALADHAISLASEAFAPMDPQFAQEELSVAAFIERAGPLKSRFTNDLRTKELVRDVLVAFGCDLDETYFDVPRLRLVPHGDYLSSGVSYAYKAHRDIWYASPTAQVNWWLPAFAVTTERAMSFFPEYWSKAVPNSSSEFDYDEWCRVGRQLATSQVDKDTRKHPLPADPISTESELRIASTKGDVIMFSAAHLHATAANRSGRTRFSIDFRTLNRSDIEQGRGAPNVDSRPSGSTIGDFIRARDFAPIQIPSAWQQP
ncbi:hypothetical protein [Montanilutibacter psychrotolerans]|uniref:Phytanoyl-CoA dioxygenase n=1 Tax=Montanilutibacter psychrotolerans TaxID=1327343 RepID=A0A3M8SXU0_9GAMM|nr:hypothetical protein [Lysobacter psychrotolerans]RNF84266.1 hypothetical protein EER27_07705 [Lysobacter psychrotolerans]